MQRRNRAGWWPLDAGHRIADAAEALGDRGAWPSIGGDLVRATLAGPGWRDLLMVAGLFDAEDRGFAPGAVASTVIRHVATPILVASASACDVYCLASYAPTPIALWRTIIGNENVSVLATIATA